MGIPKKLLVVIMLVLAVALFSGKAFAQAAVEINDFQCAVFGGDDALGDPTLHACDPFEKGNTTHKVQTPSGAVILKCSCRLPETAIVPDKTEMKEGFTCGTPFGITSDTRSVVTKGGRSNLTCMLAPLSPS